jgi:hypothetical protein
MYLEPIFSAQDIQKQLPAEHKAFDQVHRQLREIMRRTKDRPNALQITSNSGMAAGAAFDCTTWYLQLCRLRAVLIAQHCINKSART